jgi:hypothetical protein
MKALIDPRFTVRDIENSARVCQVQDVDFPVADPLFWKTCGAEVIADKYYYNTETQEFLDAGWDEPETQE